MFLVINIEYISIMSPFCDKIISSCISNSIMLSTIPLPCASLCAQPWPKKSKIEFLPSPQEQERILHLWRLWSYANAKKFQQFSHLLYKRCTLSSAQNITRDLCLWKCASLCLHSLHWKIIITVALVLFKWFCLAFSTACFCLATFSLTSVIVSLSHCCGFSFVKISVVHVSVSIIYDCTHICCLTFSKMKEGCPCTVIKMYVSVPRDRDW